MKKRFFALVLAIILSVSLIPSAFSADAASAANTLYSLGLFRGTGKDANGNPQFELDRTMTRQEAVTMLVRLLGAETDAKASIRSSPFTDVADWAKPYVGYAYEKGLTNGTGKTTFGGANTVTAAQYTTFLLRALGYSSGSDFSWDNPWSLASGLGIINGSFGNTTFLRGDAAILSLSATNATLKGQNLTLIAQLRANGAINPYQMTVSFIDVGQADCILVESKGQYMLIDAGNNDDSKLVVDYLKAQGVTTLEYVIGTHPHEDHIGGLDAVINTFDIGTVIMPNATANTKTFEDVLDIIDVKGLSITLPVPAAVYKLGSATFTIIAPCAEYKNDLNNSSVGIRLVNGKNSFVLCGDAEAISEKDIIASGTALSADVLKVGHHGSRTSTSADFLSAVNPKYAVISCGSGNTYGHPHQETLDKLKRAKIALFRTDLQDTIIATSNGDTIGWNLAPCA